MTRLVLIRLRKVAGMNDQRLDRFLDAVDKLVGVSSMSNERLAKLETNHTNMQEAVTQLVKSQQSLNDNVSTIASAAVKIESEIVRLEEKSLDKIGDVKSSLDKLDDKVGLIEGRIYVLELASTEQVSTKSKVEKLETDVGNLKLREASEEGEAKVRQFFVNNWFNLIKLLIMISTAIAVGMVMYKSMGSPTA